MCLCIYFFFTSRRRHTRCALVTGVQTCALPIWALTGCDPGPYGVQAAIAALHDEAADVETTDWPQIVALYDVLARIEPSPAVDLNRAVALAMRDGPEVGRESCRARAWPSV